PVGLVGNFIEDCDCAARFKKISKIILRHEGGYVNRSDDKGGATNHGIAWSTWQKYAEEDVGVTPTLDNLKDLTEQQAEVIYLKRYWQPKGFCGFKDERVALMSYDWSITSGGAALQIQKMLNQKYHSNIVEDGGMGKQTIDAINAIVDQESLLQDIAAIRRQYYTNLTIKDPGQIGNLKGWLNRVNDCLQVQV
ncbi:glycoside hydrolase family 108 protein, partial [Paraburkholderia sp. J12]|uniref:glycoside hydrolase family 108 protein n=1 Tax=Paraburkholderia sp. J12 TaxID=2805432 RepID=UPI002ABE11CA